MTGMYKYEAGLYSQYEKLLSKFDEQTKAIKEQSAIIKELNATIKLLNKNLNEAHLEIERLKNQINKDSSNSSKPSGTNGFKKVMNTREKSNNKKGAQKGHSGKTLSPKYIEKLISEDKVDEVKIIEIGKNEFNKNRKPIIKYTYDLEIRKVVTKILYYPNSEVIVPIGKIVSYGNNLQSLSCLLSNNYISYDGITEIFKHLTNDTIKISKGTLLSWNEKFSLSLNPEIENIKNELLNSLILHVDESPIKIDGKQYYIHTISNGSYTLQYKTKHRSKDDVDAFGFLSMYKGILIHDHYTMYYNYGTDHAECNVHILRYLNGVTEFTKHTWAKELKELLLQMKSRKEELMTSGKDKILDIEFNAFRERYITILKNGKQERMKDIDINAYKDDEISLLNRLIKYEHNHLLFLQNFIVPFSNNQAEADLRKIKIKQKIGKFRSETGADIYAIIRSCASTYSKNNINLFNAFKSALSNNAIII